MQKLLQNYAQHGIKITLTPKRVKNINFRLKPIDEPPFFTLMAVSYPPNLPQTALIQSLQNRLTWAIDCQQKQQKRQENKPKQSAYFNDIKDLENLTLDSEVFYQGEKWRLADLITDFLIKNGVEKSIIMAELPKFNLPSTLSHIYKHWLSIFIHERQAFWQAKVGKSATKITPYTMKTRWGSCSTQAKTIRLSIWLTQFPSNCADYVLVHELCHLHEANHSAKFWACVEKAMPDYQIWHKMLKSGLEDDV